MKNCDRVPRLEEAINDFCGSKWIDKRLVSIQHKVLKKMKLGLESTYLQASELTWAKKKEKNIKVNTLRRK